MDELPARVTGLRTYEVLSQTGFFADLSVEQLERIAAVARFRDLPQDSHLYGIGQPADDFYVLVDGMVRFTIGYGAREASGGEIIRRGEVFGWAALMESAQRRIATAYCLTSATVLAIDGNTLLRLMEEDNSLGYRIMRQLALLVTTKLTAFASG